MNRWFTTADENAAPGGMTGLVGAFSLEFKHGSTAKAQVFSRPHAPAPRA